MTTYVRPEPALSENSRRAILVVSFGTSYEDTRKITIEAIEQRVAEIYPEQKLYRAWTSKMIIAKLKKRDNLHIHNVKEAMQAMREDGITDVLIQPTHIINGIENELMKEDALSFQDSFHSISFGTPLLTSVADNELVIDAVIEEFSFVKEDEVLVLMGHGTTHYSNSIYAALDYAFKDKGHPNFFLGTVEAYPSLESLVKMVRDYNPSKIYLAPFMIVAGDHAKNDMASDDPDSWHSQFSALGIPVVSILKGLGEYPAIRSIFIEHIKEVERTFA
ncbi:MAG: sirohydrochlorin cobaltochelatase [Lachnospiraceae bacterium]